MSIAAALLAIAELEPAEAAVALERALERDPDDALARALRDGLRSDTKIDVYGRPTAFSAFIDNGRNPDLYAAAIAALRALHSRRKPDTVLDIGCGDGRVTDAAMDPSATHLSLLEPSSELLGAAAALITASPRPTRSIELLPMAAVDLLEREPDRHWDLVQSTFAIHTTTPADRPLVLSYLHEHADTVALVEFDVPSFADRSIEHATYAAERYQIGLAEYRDHPEVIAGFLLPVLVGQFDPKKPRLTYEQPAQAWADDLRAAGFAVTIEPIFDYWWAPAVFITATTS